MTPVTPGDWRAYAEFDAFLAGGSLEGNLRETVEFCEKLETACGERAPSLYASLREGIIPNDPVLVAALPSLPLWIQTMLARPERIDPTVRAIVDGLLAAGGTTISNWLTSSNDAAEKHQRLLMLRECAAVASPEHKELIAREVARSRMAEVQPMPIENMETPK